MIRRLAHALVGRYPQPWRERYETEACALIDDSSIRGRDLCELFRGLLTERARELVSADDRPKRTAAILAFVHPAFNVVWVGLAVGTGFALRALAAPWSESTRDVAELVLVVLVFVFLALLAALLFRRRGRSSTEPRLSAGDGVALLPWLFVLIAAVVWAGFGYGPTDYQSRLPEWLRAVMWLYVALSVTSHLSSSLWPGQQMLQAFAMLEFAEQQITSNQRWVEGCHEMVAKGVASPLGEAKAQVEHWTRERDAARERLHTLGYRARFRLSGPAPRTGH